MSERPWEKRRYMADWNHYLVGYLRVREDGTEWVDHEHWHNPPPQETKLEDLIPDDAVLVLALPRMINRIQFWEVEKGEICL